MRNLLIIRLSAIGDVIFATTVLGPLRQAYPEARITWLTGGLGAELLQGHPALDEILVAPEGHWRRLWRSGQRWQATREVLRFARELRSRRFDTVIDLQGLLKSSALGWATRARTRLVLRPREGAQLLASRSVRVSRGFRGRIGHEYHLLVDAEGWPKEAARLWVEVQADQRAKAAALLGEGESPIFLFPFTTRPQKHWFAENWAELARRLHEETQRPVWILGGPDDAPAAEAIARAAAPAPVQVRAGRASNLSEKAALLERGSLCIGVDTGLTHLAYALRIPTVGLFGSTCPYEDPAPSPGEVLYEPLDCSPCRRHPTCNGAFTCMRLLTVERVLEAARRWLNPHLQPV